MVYKSVAASTNSGILSQKYIDEPENSRTCLLVFGVGIWRIDSSPTLRQAPFASPYQVASAVQSRAFLADMVYPKFYNGCKSPSVALLMLVLEGRRRPFIYCKSMIPANLWWKSKRSTLSWPKFGHTSFQHSHQRGLEIFQILGAT